MGRRLVPAVFSFLFLPLLAAQTLSVSPVSMGFQAAAGTAATGQSLRITNAGSGSLTFTAAVSTSSGGNWLSVTPASGTAPATLTVGATAAGLVAGTYFGQVTITAAGPAASPARVLITLVVTAPSVPTGPAPASVTRRMVTHQITNWTTSPNNGNGIFPVLSGDGSRVAFTLGAGTQDPATPNRIMVINSDGTGLREVDSYASLCFCPSGVRISHDGSKILSTEGVQVRISNADGSGRRALVSLGLELSSVDLTADGSKAILNVRRDTTIRGTNTPIQRGVWVINTDGTGLRQVTGPDQVGSLYGTASGNVFPFSGAAGGTLGVSRDGSRIVFAVTIGTDQRVLGVNLDGSGLHDLAGQVRFVLDAGISADGSKAFYNVTPPTGPQQTAVVNFDGTSGRRVLVDSGMKLGYISSADVIELSEDGRRLLFGSTGLAIDTTTGIPIQLAVGFGGEQVTYLCTMNSTATRFLYMVDIGGILQFYVTDLNPSSLGLAASISDITLSPGYVTLNRGVRMTVTARAGLNSGTLRLAQAHTLRPALIPANPSFQGDGLQDGGVNSADLKDDRTLGDVTAGDGVFTNNDIGANCCALIGPREERIKVETLGSDGRRHIIQVDVAPFQVLSAAPIGSAPVLTGISPSSGQPGAQVTIAGSGFSTVAGDNDVSFGGVDATVVSATSTALVVTVPASVATGTALVGVIRSGLVSNPLAFTVLAPASFALAPRRLSLTAIQGGPAFSQVIEIQVVGATVNWEASVTLSSGANWLTLGSTSGTASTAVSGTLVIQVNPATLPTAGLYQALVSISSTSSRFGLQVPVDLALGAARPRLVANRQTLVFNTLQGSSGSIAQKMLIGNAGSGTLTYSVPANPAPWLTISPASGTASTNRQQPTELTFTVNPAGLAAGVHQVLAPITAPGAANSTVTLAVTLEIRASTGTPLAELTPHGLLFVTGLGSGQPPPKTFTLRNAGAGTLTFTLSASTTSGGNWLSLSSTNGTAPAARTSITVNTSATGLAAGFYRGRIVASFSSGPAQEVDVLLVVAPFAVTPLGADGAAAGGVTETCAPASMDLVATSVGSGLSVPVSYPRTLMATIVDNCGGLVSNATVIGAIDAAVLTLQSLGNGSYSANWTPARVAATITAQLTALHPVFPKVSKTLTLSTSAAIVELPVLSDDGVVEGAGFTPRRPLAPGGIISLFGSRFAGSEAGAAALPLSRELNGVSVRIGGQNAPLYYVSAGQVNAQVPFEVADQESVSVSITANGRLTAPQTYSIAAGQPGVFRAGAGGAILDAGFQLLTATNPAHAGDVIQIFATGLGLAETNVESGAAAPASNVRLAVDVTVGGIPAVVQYQGFAPGFVGLYQVNIVVPAGTPTGDTIPVVLRQNGVISNPDAPATIWVR